MWYPRFALLLCRRLGRSRNLSSAADRAGFEMLPGIGDRHSGGQRHAVSCEPAVEAEAWDEIDLFKLVVIPGAAKPGSLVGGQAAAVEGERVADDLDPFGVERSGIRRSGETLFVKGCTDDFGILDLL